MGGFSPVVFLMRLFDFYQILIVVWCILSWFPIPREGIVHDIVAAVDALVSPYINLFRRLIPPFGGLDFSPILAIIVLGLIERLILRILL
jgi:YggT family protein